MYAFVCICLSPQCNYIQWFTPNERKNVKNQPKKKETVQRKNSELKLNRRKFAWLSLRFARRLSFLSHPLPMHSLLLDFYRFYCTNITEVAFSVVFLVVAISIWLSVSPEKNKFYERKPKYSRFGAYIWWFWQLSGWADKSRNQWHSNMGVFNLKML